MPPTTTEASLVAVTFKGAYLARENLQDLNAVFATADQEKLGNFGRSLEAVKRLRDVSPEIKVHYA